jgi:uncharacterized protein YndB with AHSA1/START domain
MKNPIRLEIVINKSILETWNAWTSPIHIEKWNHAGDDWHCPKAINDLTLGGRFSYTMAAIDGSMSFDFSGVYTAIENHKRIAYTMDDGRKAEVQFIDQTTSTLIIEKFEAENENPREMQEMGWQLILNNFKSYTESVSL